MTKLTAACVQMRSTAHVEENLRAAEGMVREAKQKGAALIVLPENATSMVGDNSTKLKNSYPEEEHPALPLFSKLGKELGVFIVAGSLAIRAGRDKIYNRCVVFGPLGEIRARYDKIHLYDAEPQPGEAYKESELILSGNRAVVTDIGYGKLGLTICYDVRFPALFHALALKGAEIITVPSAFTVPSGQAHWHVLLRARAIETGCYIVAPAQGGQHASGRSTYGHSLIISPWGEILAEAGEEPGIITAELDLEKVKEARKKIPNLRHARAFEGP